MDEYVISCFDKLSEKCKTEYSKKIIQSYKNKCRSITKKYIREHKIKFKNCLICGKEGYLEIHHKNYDNPFIIAPLCKSCHGIQHSKKAKNVEFIDIYE